METPIQRQLQNYLDRQRLLQDQYDRGFREGVAWAVENMPAEEVAQRWLEAHHSDNGWDDCGREVPAPESL